MYLCMYITFYAYTVSCGISMDQNLVTDYTYDRPVFEFFPKFYQKFSSYIYKPFVEKHNL